MRSERNNREAIKMRKKILDFVAALCFCFDVDWDQDCPDDEYCLEKKVTVGTGKANITVSKDIPRAG